MKTAVFDLETSGFYADADIILCYVRQSYGTKDKPFVLRADSYPTWDKHRSNDSGIVKDIIKDLSQFDIIVAHNGEKFDKAFLNSKCLEYGIEPRIRHKKSIDPVWLARKYLRLGRNSLAAVIDYLKIPVKKTPLEMSVWRRAALDGDKSCMNKIVAHCKPDVNSLVLVYDKMRGLIDKIDTRGSSY